MDNKHIPNIYIYYVYIYYKYILLCIYTVYYYMYIYIGYNNQLLFEWKVCPPREVCI